MKLNPGLKNLKVLLHLNEHGFCCFAQILLLYCCGSWRKHRTNLHKRRKKSRKKVVMYRAGKQWLQRFIPIQRILGLFRTNLILQKYRKSHKHPIYIQVCIFLCQSIFKEIFVQAIRYYNILVLSQEFAIEDQFQGLLELSFRIMGSGLRG